MNHAEIVARRAGYPLRVFSTVTPSRWISDADRPALFNDINNREWKFLSRRGKGPPHCSQRTREHPLHDENLVGLHQHSCSWLDDDTGLEELMRALLGSSNYEWRGDKWVGENNRVNIALEANEGTSGIISRTAYMAKERAGKFQGWLNKSGQLEKGGEFWKWEQTRDILEPRRSQTNGLRGLRAADAAEQERRPRVYPGARLLPPTAAPTPPTEPLAATIAYETINQTSIPNSTVKEGLFDALDVVSARPKAKRTQQRRENMPEPSLPMDYPPTIKDKIQILHLTMTDAKIAALLLISRPQATNIRNGRYGTSRQVVRRILEMARAA